MSGTETITTSTRVILALEQEHLSNSKSHTGAATDKILPRNSNSIIWKIQKYLSKRIRVLWRVRVIDNRYEKRNDQPYWIKDGGKQSLRFFIFCGSRGGRPFLTGHINICYEKEGESRVGKRSSIER